MHSKHTSHWLIDAALYAGLITTLILVTFKIVLHRRWVVMISKKVLAAPASPPARPAPTTSRVPTGQISRAEFIKVMGVVCVASFLALTRAVDSLQLPESEDTNETQTAQASGTAGSDLASASQACSVRCDRSCTYPGNCHRYADSNNNQRCDFGECA